jgi:hypothetical protein
LKIGDSIQLRRDDGKFSVGRIRLVYPEIENGRVVADADVGDLGDYFVGERVRVIIASAPRTAIVVPTRFVFTRFGVDYVRIQHGADTIEAPVQRGRPTPLSDQQEDLEILSGVRPGDVLVGP